MNHEIAIKIEEKEWEGKDYSRMVRFFDGRLFSSHGVFPLSAMLWGFFLEKEDEKE
jgi:hypothetical protein